MGLMIDSLITKPLWSYLCVKTINKLNSLWVWHVHTDHPQHHQVNIDIVIIVVDGMIINLIARKKNLSKIMEKGKMVIEHLCSQHIYKDNQ